MSQTIEWAGAADAAFALILGDEDAGDGNTPNEGTEDAGYIALVLDGCAIYGTPGELLELLSDAVAQVSAHLAGQS